MELCSLEEAYSPPKDMASFLPKPGCTDTKPSREERRAARKKAKKCKGPVETYLDAKEEPPVPETDPDRPAVKRMGEVPAFMPVGEAFPDLSGSEGFRLPRMPPSSCTFSDAGLPAYFGKGLDDADEGFQDYGGAGGLIPQTLEGGFEAKGVAKAGSGSGLPAPPLVDAWKPLGSAGAPTAFVPSLLAAPTSRIVETTVPASGPTVGPYGPKRLAPTAPPVELPKELLPTTSTHGPAQITECETSRDILLSKLQELTRRLEQLEKGGVTSTLTPRHPRQEMLLFIATGVGVLVSLDLIVRAAR